MREKMRATEALRTALAAIIEEEGLTWPAKTVIEPPRDPRHGDLSVNAAMLLAREAKANPRELAQKFATKLLKRCPEIEQAEAAGPGFCNVTFSQSFWRRVVSEIEAAGGGLWRKRRRARPQSASGICFGKSHRPSACGARSGAAVGDVWPGLLRKAGLRRGHGILY